MEYGIIVREELYKLRGFPSAPARRPLAHALPATRQQFRLELLQLRPRCGQPEFSPSPPCPHQFLPGRLTPTKHPVMKSCLRIGIREWDPRFRSPVLPPLRCARGSLEGGYLRFSKFFDFLAPKCEGRASLWYVTLLLTSRRGIHMSFTSGSVLQEGQSASLRRH